MARNNRTKVYLGYEDDYVTDKHRNLINFTTNKIGGFPVSIRRKSLLKILFYAFLLFIYQLEIKN